MSHLKKDWVFVGRHQELCLMSRKMYDPGCGIDRGRNGNNYYTVLSSAQNVTDGSVANVEYV